MTDPAEQDHDRTLALIQRYATPVSLTGIVVFLAIMGLVIWL